ncbi:hypothetical protein SUGI_0647140 [Cryptomeria japonica]|uniref:uncharacterized protein LOC131079309 n=1 Tax=Cryptomeria japonica TaxID=3369 RepID=UPI00241487A4|nr:uncharacterized protein LOC131079309 [Cryptomeria japonica]GLJ32138.1 hypothetical protein SUGI_0647140 [Cryptomeria japonica]
MNQSEIYPCIIVVLLLYITAIAAAGSYERTIAGSIAFSTAGRAQYAFDIYALNITSSSPKEDLLTDGISVNYNGNFLGHSAIEALMNKVGMPENQADQVLAYITERYGLAQIFFNFYSKNLSLYSSKSMESIFGFSNFNRREALDTTISQEWVPLNFVKDGVNLDDSVSMKDRPIIVDTRIIYVSTHQPSGVPRQSWAAVYSTDLNTGETIRLTPDGLVDLSPSLSPSGEWIMVASFGHIGWHGQTEDLQTDLYLFNVTDGSNRQLAIRNGGWPSWADDHTIFFHRKSDDGWWSIYRASFSAPLNKLSQGHVTVDRITPTGLHAFTPACSLSEEWVAVATHKPGTEYRHIEIYNLTSNSLVEITRGISPQSYHFNPFVSYDSHRIGYHKCRGNASVSSEDVDSLRVPVIEYVKSPLLEISLFRIDGEFPSFSPDGSMVAYISMEGDAIYVTRLDGSKTHKVFSGLVFGLAWDWKKNGIIYTSHGPDFASLSTKVDIIALNVSYMISRGKNDPNPPYRKLTSQGNNAFPSPSPDGNFLVFRSGRSGYKNLYIMDQEQGERGHIWRLTNGPWTDTMCNWSPDGNWIAFSSDRDNPGSGSFALYLIHPNGTGLQKVLNSSTFGRVNHPWFSPDSKSLIFTSDYAGVSAEPISVPYQFGPYGEIFMSNIDGSDVQRLTHNAYEDGTPSWGKTFVSPSDLIGKDEKLRCGFEDDRWLNGNVSHFSKFGCRAM